MDRRKFLTLLGLAAPVAAVLSQVLAEDPNTPVVYGLGTSLGDFNTATMKYKCTERFVHYADPRGFPEAFRRAVEPGLRKVYEEEFSKRMDEWKEIFK